VSSRFVDPSHIESWFPLDPNQFPHNSPSRNLLFFPSPERSSTDNGLPGQNTTPTQTITEHGKIMAKSWQNLLNFGGSSQFPWSKKPVLASMPSGTNIVLRGGSRNSLPEHDVCSQAFFSLEGSCKGCCTSQANLSDMVIPAVNMAMVGMVQIFGYHWYYLHCTKKKFEVPGPILTPCRFGVSSARVAMLEDFSSPSVARFCYKVVKPSGFGK